MILRSFEHDNRTWTVCLRVAPDSVARSGLDLVFVPDGTEPSGSAYVWPAEDEVLRVLHRDPWQIQDAVLIGILRKAIGSRRVEAGIHR